MKTFPKKRNIHRPTHLYLSHKLYFITGKTLHGEKYFNTNQKKIIFTQIFNNLSKQMSVKIYAWILLDNHYHLLVSFNDSLTAVTPMSVTPMSVTPMSATPMPATPMSATPMNSAPANINPTISKFINRLHAITALKLNKLDNTKSRKVWYQYFDKCIRSEKDFWIRFNYIHNNPVKHGYVKNLNELEDYKFSSYSQWLKKNSKEWMASCFAQYPVVDFSCEDDSE